MHFNRLQLRHSWTLLAFLFIFITAFPSVSVAQVSYVPKPALKQSAARDALNRRQVYEPAGAAKAVSFDASALEGEDLVLPTTLDFGPDGRLYVAQLNGLINAYTVVKNGPNDYEITDTEPIRVLKENIDNYDDDGALNTSEITQSGFPLNLAVTRQITGILLLGTPSNPIIYATSSDPRHGGGDLNGIDDSGLDTNSGVISRLTWDGTNWNKVDLVRGLPRSEENHSVNGIRLDEANNILYVAVGGLTNGGAPSNNFTRITEYAMSAAILKVDLDVIEALPLQGSGNTSYYYDMPTVDDPTRDNVNGITDPNDGGYDGVDVGDPFGGNNGLNQSKLVPGGPVQLHATGLRNPYDLVIMETPGYEGKMYTIDNGANPGWGGHPIGEGAYPGGSAGLCTNDYDASEPGSTGPGPNDGQVNNLNGLHYVRELEAGRPYYAGHPTPIRGNPSGAGLYTYFDGAGAFRTSTTGPNPLPADWPPIPVSEGYPAECDFRNSGVDDGSLVDYVPSTNGMAEYTASNFDGEIQGAIISAGFSGEVYIAKLNAAGDAVTNGVDELFNNFGVNPLDVIAQGDDDPFPGTIWAVTYGSWSVTVFEPVEGEVCVGGPGSQDDDGDGYSNDDEIANETNECSAADKPNDADGDLVSDLNDADDDNDTINDVDDAFAIDAANGIGTTLPIKYDLFNEEPATGFFGLGLTGLMNNGTTDWLDQFDTAAGIFGGTAGLLTFPTVTEGTALGSQNDQDNALQFGVDVSSSTATFEVEVVIKPPFFSTATPQDGQSHGFYIGTGDQDNYLKVALAANGGNGGIEVVQEVAGTPTTTLYGNNLSGGEQIPDDVLGASGSLSLLLQVDPAAGTVLPGYQVDNDEPFYMGSPITLSGATLTALQSSSQALAIGVIATSSGPGDPFTATWDKIDATTVSNGASALVQIAPPEDINTSTVASGSFSIENTSTNGQKITSVSYDLGTAIFPDVVFDPTGSAGDITGQDFQADEGESQTGFTNATLESPHNNVDGDDGYDALTVTFSDFDPGDTFGFSIDIDPTSIKGSSAPGPGESGSISGLELTGTTVTVAFDDGSEYTTEVFQIDGSISASEGIAAVDFADAPAISIPGASTLKSKVDNLDQTIRISGPIGQQVRLLVAEAALFLPAGGGNDIDAFEANSILSVQAFEETIGGSGFIDFNVTLGNSQAEGGINYAVAAYSDAEGRTGELSDVVVLDYDPDGVATNIVRINAGGPTVSVNGVAWDADQFFTGGGTFTNATDIAATDSDLIYQTERFDAGMSGLTYSIPVPGDGDYNVTLHFAEIFFGAPGGGSELGGAGQRVFTMEIEGGQATIDELDIYDEVGAATALVYTFEDISVTDGALEITMTSNVREGKISGIEVSTLGDPSPITASPNPVNFYVAEVGGSSNPRTITVSNSGADAIDITGVSFAGAASGDFTETFTAPVSIAGGATTAFDIAFAPTSEGAKSAQLEIAFTGGSGSPAKLTVNGEGQSVWNGEVLYRINAGGQAIASLDGKRVWTEDQTPVAANALGQARVGAPSPFVNSAGAGDHAFGTLDDVTLDSTVPGSVPPEVFQTERWDPASEPNQLWSFPVAAGTEVEIRVYLAEIFLTEANNNTDGPRLFDIAVDGVVPSVFDDIDAFAEVGHDVGIMKSFTTNSDGIIDLEVFKDGGENFAAIKAIEIIDPTLVSNESGSNDIPDSFKLIGNYPNPFNPTTNVIFEVPEPAEVSVEVYDVMGRKVLELASKNFAPGSGQMMIDASSLSSGIYLYRVIAEMNTQTVVKAGRMTFVK
ncbi:MAG: malectin domain-containing carbohydrate-binding protein [Rhodothermales bacterium]